MKKPMIQIDNQTGTITICGPGGEVLLVMSKKDWSFMLANPTVRR